jgi:carbon monoxide dehydrogenase subunit G
MEKVETCESIAAPSARVWAALAAFHHIDRFHPRVARVDALTDQAGGVGAVRRCNFGDGTSVVETVVDWVEGHSLQVELSEFSMPMHSAQAEFRVAEVGPDTSEVCVVMRFEPKFGVLGKLMAAMMMRPMMRRMFAEVLAGLSAHVRESGPIIPPSQAAAE